MADGAIAMTSIIKRKRVVFPKFQRQKAIKGICPDCKKIDHEIDGCPVFLGRTPKERIFLIWYWLICFSCLKIHKPRKCQLPKDFKCGKDGCTCKHHILLHGSGSLRGAQDAYFPESFKEKLHCARLKEQKHAAYRQQQKMRNN